MLAAPPTGVMPRGDWQGILLQAAQASAPPDEPPPQLNRFSLGEVVPQFRFKPRRTRGGGVDARGGHPYAQDADEPLSAGEAAPGVDAVSDKGSSGTAPPGVTPSRVLEALAHSDGQGEARAAGEDRRQQ